MTAVDPADVPYLCAECGHPYTSRAAAEACCRDRMPYISTPHDRSQIAPIDQTGATHGALRR